MTAKFALKELQVDVSLVMDDQTCALTKRHAAEGTGVVNKHASEMRCTAIRALDWDLEFLESTARKGFEACVKRPACNGRRFHLLLSISSAFMATNLDSLFRSKKL